MKKDILVLSVIAILVLLFGIGLSVGINVLIEENDISAAIEEIENLESQFKFLLSGTVNLFSYTLEVVQQQDRIEPILGKTQSEYIELTSVLETQLFELSNELKYVPIITNVTEFEELARKNIDPNFSVVDPIFNTPPEFVPADRNRQYYCPLSYMSPNTTLSLIRFSGVDLCNRSTWTPLLHELDDNFGDTIARSRLIVPTGTYTLDIGKKITRAQSNQSAYVIHSLLMNDYANDTLRRVFRGYGSNLIGIKIEKLGLVIYKTQLYDDIKVEHEATYNVKILKKLELIITFKYDREYLLSFSSNNNVIVMSIIILLFVILDSLMVIFYILYKRKKDRQNYLRLERQYSYVAKMVNYVNHEIRNPLNSILGMIDITKMDIEENNIQVSERDNVLSNLGTAYNSCILIEHIVNDVLDIRKLEGESFDLNPTTVDMEQFSREFLKLIRPKIEEHIHIKFTFDCNVDTMFVDEKRLNQILLNLCGNSFKFTEEGAISVQVFQKGETVSFEVIDTGCGIPPENVSKLFQPFAQVNVDSVSRQVGYGLGLYLCRMLVELMGGHIEFIPNENSETGSGSIFKFVLPKVFEKIEELSEDINGK